METVRVAHIAVSMTAPLSLKQKKKRKLGKKELERQEDKLQNQQASFAIQKQIRTFTGSDQKKRTRKIIRPLQGGACVCCRKRTVWIS